MFWKGCVFLNMRGWGSLSLPLFWNSVKLFKSECSSDKVATWNEDVLKGLCFPKWERLIQESLMPLFTPFENSKNFFKNECSSDKLATWNEEDLRMFWKGVFFLNKRGLYASLYPSFETPKTFLKANVRPINWPLWTRMFEDVLKGLCFPKYERLR